jgi:pimeloyl-ACP methyl ester carboxylesterase
LLSSWGVPFDGFDVENEPERRRDLEAFGIARVPATIFDGRVVHGWNPKALAELVGVRYAEHKQLAPAELARRMDAVLAATQRAMRQIPREHLGMKKPGRDRSVHQLGFHVFRLSVSFVDTREQGYLSADVFEEMAPAGMIDTLNPMLDILAVPGEQVPGLLVSDFEVLKKRLPEKPDLDFMADRYREATTVARLLWERPGDPKFMRYLHRIKMPTLIVWGEEDKIIPVQQAETWRKFIPNADIKVFKGAGHLVHLEKREAVDSPRLDRGRCADTPGTGAIRSTPVNPARTRAGARELFHVKQLDVQH